MSKCEFIVDDDVNRQLTTILLPASVVLLVYECQNSDEKTQSFAFHFHNRSAIGCDEGLRPIVSSCVDRKLLLAVISGKERSGRDRRRWEAPFIPAGGRRAKFSKMMWKTDLSRIRRFAVFANGKGAYV